ncbi:MAG: ABC transporter ATP-binding protein [Chlamydiales bacterium]|nr:ABC transporter ATP-binding protein [Chlamydiales bacterium]
MKPILTAKQICKTFTHPLSVEILKGVSLNVTRGESVAIMGASGEGKSTLLQILGTLEAPTSGELIIAGKSVSDHPPPALRNRHIGFVFQGFNLLEDYTVMQNVLMPALIAGNPIHKNSKAYERALSLLEKVGISHRAEFATKLLSGGEKQRAALARALCNDPEILLADEPSGNLDHETSNRIHELLLHSVKELNKSLIVVTHDKVLADLCDRKLILCDGYLKKED